MPRTPAPAAKQPRPARQPRVQAADRFRQALRAARKEAGLPQQRAAAAAAIPQSLWSEVEGGVAQPGLNVAERMARAVGRELAELL